MLFFKFIDNQIHDTIVESNPLGFNSVVAL